LGNLTVLNLESLTTSTQELRELLQHCCRLQALTLKWVSRPPSDHPTTRAFALPLLRHLSLSGEHPLPNEHLLLYDLFQDISLPSLKSLTLYFPLSSRNLVELTNFVLSTLNSVRKMDLINVWGAPQMSPETLESLEAIPITHELNIRLGPKIAIRNAEGVWTKPLSIFNA
jgi:hypothetical protein